MANGYNMAPRTEGVFARQFDLLKLEMTLIDSAIRAQDDITKSIKNWAIVTWTASIGFAVTQAPLKRFIWATAFVPMAFWLVDTAFRRVQRSFIVRLQDIATFINSPSFAEAARSDGVIAFELMKMRNKQGLRTSWLAVMSFRTVFVLYLLMVAGSMLVWTVI
jgi:hypothetical protein